MNLAKLEPIRHSYKPRWLVQAFTHLSNILTIAFPILYIALFIWIDIKNSNENLVVLLILQLICIVITPISFLIAGNFFTEIMSDAEGLHIIFFWRYVTVRWEDIVDLRSIALTLDKHSTFAIRASSITPFHRIYGMIYSFTLLPTLIFHKNISERHELEQRIKTAIRQNRKAARELETGNSLLI